MNSRKLALFVLGLSLLLPTAPGWAQSSGIINGVVKDPSGAPVPGATVEISYPVSGFHREVTTGTNGDFQFTNVPFNPYHLVVTLSGFSSYVQDIDVRSSVPTMVQVNLKIGEASESLTVEATGGDLVETESTPHTDVDRDLFDKLPLDSKSSSLSSLVTLASPGVVADSNGLFHGLGDHAENSFSLDGQPITDQQSKVFSNQIPLDSIQSMEVISGAPPAEFGDKTSLVIKITTRSGLGQKEPTGEVTSSYGSFGSANAGFNVAFGGSKWGNFISANGLNTGRFLDPPEFQVMHSKGNEENFFDRVDFQSSGADTIHLNLGYTRSWFQSPNSFDAQAAGQDQRSLIKTFNIAPTWTHLFNNSTLWTVGAFVRQDRYAYIPSSNPFADSPETIGQQRKLTNAGLRSDLSYVKGAHNVKVGVTFQHTLLTENFQLGLTDPTVNDTCLVPGSNFDGSDGPAGDASIHNPSGCAGAGLLPNNGSDPNAGDNVVPFLPGVLPYDLTRGGRLFSFHGNTDIKQIALYLQDTITAGNWSFNLGIRGDLYRGLVSDTQAEPRVGIAYNLKPTNTVFRVSYARVQETPFNENLIVGSQGDPNGIIASVLGNPGAIRPGARNDFHAGFQQAFGKFLVVDADYMWKYTHNSYDFSVLFDTPITFPIAWHNSKIHGFSVRASVPNFHGLTAFVVASNSSARFFYPQVGGLGTDLTTILPVFRIDHDQKFQQTTHLQYQPHKNWPWIAFTWRYDNGIVAGQVPVAADTTTPVDLTGLSADQQMQAGLFCGNIYPTLTAPLISCAPPKYGSTRIRIPAPGTVDDDKNPPRIAPRHLFDVSVGDDDLFHNDRHRWSLRLTAINITNKVALYNFLSTFSGTHFVTPRSYTAELGFHF